ncbi:MAG: hypothetical protein WC121_03075 [Candidatus Kapaibacterium sp.]
MILTIPTIYLENGKSKYTISGLPGFEKLDSMFKDNPLELAKLFREENNKSILFQIDESIESLNTVSQIQDILDIPIQLITITKNQSLLKHISETRFSRIFVPIERINSLPTSIPIIQLSAISDYNLNEYSRVMIDFKNTRLENIEYYGETKISIINSLCNTSDLVRMNTMNTNIDSVYLGKEYYRIHFAGQLLWRIAEKAQFAI